jgi:hypothetical protein
MPDRGDGAQVRPGGLDDQVDRSDVTGRAFQGGMRSVVGGRLAADPVEHE